MTIGDIYRKEGYTNCYEAHPDHDCDVEVIDHEGHRYKARFKINEFGTPCFDITKFKGHRGYDICWWREIK